MAQEQLNNEQQQVLMERIKSKSQDSVKIGKWFWPLFGLIWLIDAGMDVRDIISSQVWDAKSISVMAFHVLLVIGAVFAFFYQRHYCRQICACETAKQLLSTHDRINIKGWWVVGLATIAILFILYFGADNGKSFIIITAVLVVLIGLAWILRNHGNSDIKSLRKLVQE